MHGALTQFITQPARSSVPLEPSIAALTELLGDAG